MARRWKGNLTDEVFLDHEAQVIKDIPLSPVPTKHKLIWRCIPHGQFTIRHAYHLEMETKMRLRGGGLEPHNVGGV
jgi:hypothetical protein